MINTVLRGVVSNSFVTMRRLPHPRLHYEMWLCDGAGAQAELGAVTQLQSRIRFEATCIGDTKGE